MLNNMQNNFTILQLYYLKIVERKYLRKKNFFLTLRKKFFQMRLINFKNFPYDANSY